MSACTVCSLDLTKDKAKCCSCAGIFHPPCVGVKVLSWRGKGQAKQAQWKCPNCSPNPKGKFKFPLKEEAVMTGVKRSRGGATEDDADVDRGSGDDESAFSKKMADLLDTKLDSKLDDKLKPLEDIRSNVADIKHELSGLSDRVKKLEDANIVLSYANKDLIGENAALRTKVDGLLLRTAGLEAGLKSLEANPSSNKKLKEEVDQRFEANDRYSRRNNVVVFGLPIMNPDLEFDPVNVVLELSGAMEFRLTRADIDACHRLPAGARSKGKSIRDTPFIIRFVNRHLKEEFLKCAKKVKLRASRFGGSPDMQIYVNENLTELGSSIFREAIKLKKAGFSYVWTRNGVVFVKKDDSRGRVKFV